MRELMMVANLLWHPHFEKLAVKTQQGAQTGQRYRERQKGENVGLHPSPLSPGLVSSTLIRNLQGHLSLRSSEPMRMGFGEAVGEQLRGP